MDPNSYLNPYASCYGLVTSFLGHLLFAWLYIASMNAGHQLNWPSAWKANRYLSPILIGSFHDS